MPTFQFNDSENKVFEPLPPGDYIARVTECEFSISNGAKTSGCDKMKLKFVVEKNGEERKFSERLIFHESCGWRIDTFAKSFNLLIGGKPPTKGQPIEWSEHMVVGLRGWVTLGIREGSDKKKYNEVVTFITNKEKFPKLIEIEAAPSASDEPDPFA
jgi:hypothetical protein